MAPSELTTLLDAVNERLTTAYTVAASLFAFAVASAIVAGCRDYRMLVVLTPSEPPGTPCGLCRETLIEFGPPDLPIVLIGANGTRRDHVLSDLLPEPFQFEPTQ